MQAPVSYGSLVGAVTFLRHADRTPKSKAKLESTGDLFPATTFELLKLLTPITSSPSSPTAPKDVTSYMTALLASQRLEPTPSTPPCSGISVTSHYSTSSPTAAAILAALNRDVVWGETARSNSAGSGGFTKQVEGATRKICALITMASLQAGPTSSSITTNLNINTKLKVTIEIPAGGTRPSQINIRLSCAIGGTLTQSGADDCVLLGRQYLSQIASHRYTTPSRSLWANTRTAPDVQLYANYKDRVRKSAELFISPVLEALQGVNAAGGDDNYDAGDRRLQVVVPVHIDMLDFRPPEAAQRMAKNQAILQEACMYEPTDEAPYHPVISTQLSLDGRLEFKALSEATINHLNELVRASRDVLSPFYLPDLPRRELPLVALNGVFRLLGHLVDMLVEGLNAASQQQNEPNHVTPEPHISVTSPERSSPPPTAGARAAIMMEMSTRYAALQEKLQPTKEEGSIRATNQQAPFYLDTAEIPDLFDSLTYDLKHHRHDINQFDAADVYPHADPHRSSLLALFCFLHNYTKSVTLLVQAGETGYDRQERTRTATHIAGPLLQYVRSKVGDALQSTKRGTPQHTFLYVFVMSRMHITAVRTLLTASSGEQGGGTTSLPPHQQRPLSPAIHQAMGLSAGFLSEVTMTLWRPVGGNSSNNHLPPSIEVDTVSSTGLFGLEAPIPNRTVSSTRVPIQRSFLSQPLERNVKGIDF